MAIEEEFGLEIPDSEADKVRNYYFYQILLIFLNFIILRLHQ